MSKKEDFENIENYSEELDIDEYDRELDKMKEHIKKLKKLRRKKEKLRKLEREKEDLMKKMKKDKWR